MTDLAPETSTEQAISTEQEVVEAPAEQSSHIDAEVPEEPAASMDKDVASDAVEDQPSRESDP